MYTPRFIIFSLFFSFLVYSPVQGIERELSSRPQELIKDTLDFYKENGYKPVWMEEGKLNSSGLLALETLKQAKEEGLNPETYLNAYHKINQKGSPEQIDIVLTNQMIRFIKDIRVGRIPPSHTARIIKIISPQVIPAQLLKEALNNSSDQRFQHFSPIMGEYNALKKILATYRTIQKSFPQIPPIKTSLKKQTNSQEVIFLRKILHSYGDYKGTDLESPLFDGELETAVKSFQKRYFIEQTGEVHEKTRQALNMPLDTLIHKIIINMERLRWLPDNHMTDRYILVNVGGYEVKAYTKNHLDLRLKAIVGKTATKTPLFYAPLKNIVINPSWGVPHSILMRDKLPKILHDPSYIHRSGFTVYDSAGKVIDPDQADWANEGSHYRLRQSPGAHNALGYIKLNIENPYTIYLHGTPDTNLFHKVNRTYSSGCIRLEDPKVLTNWVLNDNTLYSLENLEKIIQKKATLTLPIHEKIHVYFTYQTVWQGDEGEVYFSPDAYHMDEALGRFLKI